MIHFFRRIRQTLLSKNKFRRYLIYAIGEIALVMIGILLALQVNNWNEGRKDRLDELGFLERLQDDIRADTVEWNFALNAIDIKKEVLFAILNNELLSISDDDFTRYLYTSRFRRLPTSDNTTFQELIGNARVGFIKNVELKGNILGYYNFIQERNTSLQSTFSEWPRLLSEIIPGQLQYNTRADPSLQLTKAEILNISNRIQSKTKILEPAINAELGYTGIQRRVFYDLNLHAIALLYQLNNELESRE